MIGGTIVEIKERGFGFKDYINNGDSREFKLLEELNGLKAGMLLKAYSKSVACQSGHSGNVEHKQGSCYPGL